MDPNANLAEQEDLLTRPLAGTNWTRNADRARLAELRQALSLWLSLGGFAPAWEACPHAAAWYRQHPGQRDLHAGLGAR